MAFIMDKINIVRIDNEYWGIRVMPEMMIVTVLQIGLCCLFASERAYAFKTHQGAWPSDGKDD